MNRVCQQLIHHNQKNIQKHKPSTISKLVNEYNTRWKKNITEEDFYKNFKKKSSELIVSNR